MDAFFSFWYCVGINLGNGIDCYLGNDIDCYLGNDIDCYLVNDIDCWSCNSQWVWLLMLWFSQWVDCYLGNEFVWVWLLWVMSWCYFGQGEVGWMCDGGKGVRLIWSSVCE